MELGDALNLFRAWKAAHICLKVRLASGRNGPDEFDAVICVVSRSGRVLLKRTEPPFKRCFINLSRVEIRRNLPDDRWSEFVVFVSRDRPTLWIGSFGGPKRVDIGKVLP